MFARQALRHSSETARMQAAASAMNISNCTDIDAASVPPTWGCTLRARAPLSEAPTFM